MSLNSLKLRIDGDGSSGNRAISSVLSNVNKLGASIQHEIGDRWNNLFSATAIEEVIRRTGEWAENIQKTAKEINITTTQLQAMEVAARKANLDPGKVQSYYNKIEVGATKALAGNKELMDSFKRLGVSRDMLLSKDPAVGGVESLRTTMFNNAKGHDADILRVFGPRELTNVKSLQKEMGGKSSDEYAAEHKSQIVSAEDVGSMAASWKSFVEDLKSLGVALAPYGKILLAMLSGLMSMLTGLLQYVTLSISQAWRNITTGFGHFGSADARAAQKKGAEELDVFGKTMMRSIVNMIPQTVGAVATLATGEKGYMDAKWMEHGREIYKGQMTEERFRQAEGAGEGLATIATFGTGAIAKATGMGLKGISSVAGVVSAEGLAAKTGAMALKVEGRGAQGLLGYMMDKTGATRTIGEIADSHQFAKFRNGLGYSKSEFDALPVSERRAAFQMFNADTGNGGIRPNSLFGKKGKVWGSRLGYAGYATVAGGLGLGIAEADAAENDVLGPNRGNGLGNFGSALGGGGTNPNLKIGDVFGVDVSMKILNLNERMVDLLQQIVLNTGNDSAFTTDDTVPNY